MLRLNKERNIRTLAETTQNLSLTEQKLEKSLLNTLFLKKTGQINKLPENLSENWELLTQLRKHYSTLVILSNCDSFHPLLKEETTKRAYVAFNKMKYGEKTVQKEAANLGLSFCYTTLVTPSFNRSDSIR